MTSRRSSMESRSGSNYAGELAAMAGTPAAIFVPEQHDAILRVGQQPKQEAGGSLLFLCHFLFLSFFLSSPHRLELKLCTYFKILFYVYSSAGSALGTGWSSGEGAYFGKTISHASFTEAGVSKERQNYGFVVKHASEATAASASAAAGQSGGSDSIGSAGSLPRLVHAEHFQHLAGSLKIPPLPPSLGYTPGISQRLPRRTQSGRSSKPLQLWRPTQLVHTLHEHSGAIRAIAVANTHQFILTGGDDGLLRAWSLRSMLEVISVRSSAQYDVGSPIVDLVMVGETQSVAVAALDAHIYIVRADLSSTLDVGSLSLLNTIEVVDGEASGQVVSLAHISTTIQSLLVYSTERGGFR
jgi:hypothetical protein